MVAARNHELATERASQLGRTARSVEIDLRDAASVRAAIEFAHEAGPTHILVLNGGGPPRTDAARLEDDDLQMGSHLLLEPMVSLVRGFLPSMRDQGWGRIVAITSSGVLQPIPGLATSNIYRSALTAYLKTLASEIAGDGVTVNTVVPGRFDTDRTRALDTAQAAATGSDYETIRDKSLGTIPLGRFGRPSELAAVATFLCSEVASYVTGQQLRVDGGAIRAI
jgi:3-oxoacyl-[acyl-carrier protein] reductase